jgi:hypothetical protein
LKLLPLLLFCLNFANAQELSGDSLQILYNQSYPVKLYYQAIGENAHLYNGYEYMTPDARIKGSPFFLTDQISPADLSYDDGYYSQVPIRYDIVLDLVVINRLDQNYTISLISEKLKSFSLLNHYFIRINKDSLHGSGINTGFYDRIYGGKSTTIVKRKKTVLEQVQLNIGTMYYLDENIYYVKFGGKYVEVKGKSSVLNLFKDKKSEIKSFLRKNKLNFKSDFEKTLIATSAYYDQLTS